MKPFCPVSNYFQNYEIRKERNEIWQGDKKFKVFYYLIIPYYIIIVSNFKIIIRSNTSVLNNNQRRIDMKSLYCRQERTWIAYTKRRAS